MQRLCRFVACLCCRHLVRQTQGETPMQTLLSCPLPATAPSPLRSCSLWDLLQHTAGPTCASCVASYLCLRQPCVCGGVQAWGGFIAHSRLQGAGPARYSAFVPSAWHLCTGLPGYTGVKPFETSAIWSAALVHGRVGRLAARVHAAAPCACACALPAPSAAAPTAALCELRCPRGQHISMHCTHCGMVGAARDSG